MKNIYLLNAKLENISERGWMAVDNKYTGSIGMEIEKLLNVQNNNLEYPDFEGIEIKTKINSKGGFFTLFNANPDNSFFETKRIHNNFGYPNSKNKKFNIFNVSIYSKKVISLSNYSFKIYIDDLNKKIVMIVRGKDGEIVEEKVSWSFDMLEEKFKRKFTYFCFINVETKIVNNCSFFKIKNFNIYTCQSFSDFINLVKNDKIRITFKIGIFTSGKRIGQIHDRGTGFDLSVDSIDKLFSRVDCL